MRRLNDEDGSMVVAVGVLFTTLVIVLTMVVDTGIVYNERGELQSGADAAALAVAHSCARSSGCDTSLASEYTTANARGPETSDVETVNVDTGAGTVEVVTRTASTQLEAAQLLGQSTALVRARGRARWGAAGAIPGGTFPFAISACDIDAALTAQGGYISIPPTPSGTGAVILFHDGAAATQPDCPNSFPFDENGDGKLPGGFGKLELDGTEPCKVVTYTDGLGNVWAPVKEGASAPPDWRCLQMNQVNYIPIFGDFRVVAGADEYRIVGYSAFYVTGVRMPGYVNNPPCGGSSTCISGWFTTGTVSGGPMCTNPSICSYGVSVVRLSY
ncbi:MAG: hypothetical protein H0V19_03150 [Euzebyales bacterium]|nr:hypothetical protein [Euzebyales bacterium]